MAERKTDTIPKLDQVSYLFETLGCINNQLSFDAIRKELIDLRAETHEALKRVTPITFWSNARDAIRELMRLDLVNRSSLPSRPGQLDAHRKRIFELTEHGEQFLALEKCDPLEFRYRFAQTMFFGHRYLRELHSLLIYRELFFPRIQRSELPGDVESWQYAPPEPLGQVSSWIAESVRKVMRLNIMPDSLEQSMRPYLVTAWKRLDRDQKSHMFNKAVVKTFNDVIVRVLLQIYGLRVDYVTFRSAVALLTDLKAIWHTRSLTDRRGWTIWGTSVSQVPPPKTESSPAESALQGPVWFTPRVAADDAIKDELIATFLSFSDRRGGFALIHVLRAEVCHKLGIHGRDFDAVLRKLHAQTLTDPTYMINLDRGGSDEVPPSEEPFRIQKRAFYLITLLKRNREESRNGTP